MGVQFMSIAVEWRVREVKYSRSKAEGTEWVGFWVAFGQLQDTGGKDWRRRPGNFEMNQKEGEQTKKIQRSKS